MSTGVRAVVILLFVGIAIGAVVTSTSQAPQAGVAVLVNARDASGSIGTRLGTQFVWPDVLGRAEVRDRFDELRPELVRINATTLGTRKVLPAGVSRGDWDFSNLDSIVDDIRKGGGQVVLTIAYAPEWMWSCAPGKTRAVAFDEFAAYMARLVGYYNRGSFVAEDGRTITNPAGATNRIDYWELWNEPDLLAGCPPDGNQLSAREYLAMWNLAVPAMRGVDPSIKLVGPATANATSRSVPDYLPTLLSEAIQKPDIVSFHAYGGWLNSQADRFLFDGQNGMFGIEGIERGLAWVKDQAHGIPVWITELNVNSAWEPDPEASRPWDAFAAAWGASAFRRLALDGVDAVFQ